MPFLKQAFSQMFAILFANLSGFSQVFLLSSFQTCSDLMGPVRMRSDAFGYISVRLDAFGHFRKFLDFSDCLRIIFQFLGRFFDFRDPGVYHYEEIRSRGVLICRCSSQNLQ